jgi:hypothetical protein
MRPTLLARLVGDCAVLTTSPSHLVHYIRKRRTVTHRHGHRSRSLLGRFGQVKVGTHRALNRDALFYRAIDGWDAIAAVVQQKFLLNSKDDWRDFPRCVRRSAISPYRRIPSFGMGVPAGCIGVRRDRSEPASSVACTISLEFHGSPRIGHILAPQSAGRRPTREGAEKRGD